MYGPGSQDCSSLVPYTVNSIAGVHAVCIVVAEVCDTRRGQSRASEIEHITVECSHPIVHRAMAVTPTGSRSDSEFLLSYLLYTPTAVPTTNLLTLFPRRGFVVGSAVASRPSSLTDAKAPPWVPGNAQSIASRVRLGTVRRGCLLNKAYDYV